jgi:hypothetical protein
MRLSVTPRKSPLFHEQRVTSDKFRLKTDRAQRLWCLLSLELATGNDKVFSLSFSVSLRLCASVAAFIPRIA